MIKVKYFLLARVIKVLLQLGFLFGVFSLLFNIFTWINGKSYIRIANGTLGYERYGYTLKASMGLHFPDTISYYQNGQRSSNIGDVDTAETKVFRFKKEEMKAQLVNVIKSYETDDVSIHNSIYAADNIRLRAISKNKWHNIFWAFGEQFDILIYLAILVILIKLSNRYMDNLIFEKRTFKLISILGVILIFNEIATFLIGILNMTILQHPQMQTKSLTNVPHYANMNLSFNFTNNASLTMMIVGTLVILLSHVIKEAVVAKKENELTI